MKETVLCSIAAASSSPSVISTRRIGKNPPQYSLSKPTQPSPFKYSLNIPTNHNPNKYPIILYGLKIPCQPISSHCHEPWSYLRYPTIPVLRLRRRSRRSRSIWIQAIIVNQHTITTWLVQARLCYPLAYGTNHAKPTWFQPTKQPSNQPNNNHNQISGMWGPAM